MKQSTNRTRIYVVKITNADGCPGIWYAKRIGQLFEVVREKYPRDRFVIDRTSVYSIRPEHCEVVSERVVVAKWEYISADTARRHKRLHPLDGLVKRYYTLGADGRLSLTNETFNKIHRLWFVDNLPQTIISEQLKLPRHIICSVLNLKGQYANPNRYFIYENETTTTRSGTTGTSNFIATRISSTVAD